MSPALRKWLKRILKLAVCAAALWYLSGKVAWYDYARLSAEPQIQWRLVSTSGEQLTIENPQTGEKRGVNSSELARPEQLEKGQRPIERGLRYIIKNADRSWAILALLLFGPAVPILAWRLQLLLDTQDISISYRDALLLTFAGNFFNFAMPGTTGGDIYKAYHIARRTHKRTEGITVVILDRVIGLVSFLILAGVIIFASWGHPMIGEYGKYVGYIMIAFLLCAALFFSQRFRRLIRYQELLGRLPFADKLRRIDETTLSLRFHKKDSILSLAITIFSHFLLVTSVYFLARGLKINPAPPRTQLDLMAASMLATVVGYLFAAVPISFQGFGLLEAVFAKVFVSGHWSTYSQMLALTLGIRLIQIAWALPGVIVPWLGFARPTHAEEEKELGVTV